MCGRFALTVPVDGIRKLFGFTEIPNLPPRYNIAPTQAVLAVRDDGGVPSAFMTRWGLIPSWSKDPTIGAKMINARSETIREKPSFKTAFSRRRCLIPADGFYEWKTQDGVKQPYRLFFSDKEVFAFAGIWERWQGGDGSDVDTCSIVTTEAIASIAPIHHRMPVILDADAFSSWMSGPEDEAEDLMRPYRGSRVLMHHPVSRAVGDVRNDRPELLDEVTLEAPMDAPSPAKVPADDQLSLF